MDITQLSTLQYIWDMRIDTERLLTPNGYRLKTGIARSTVYKQIQAGTLQTINIDGVIFVILRKQLPHKANVPPQKAGNNNASG
jgi:hypothetical protein